MNANPDAAIGLKLGTPYVDPKEFFANAGVPIRAINAEPPLSDKTYMEENRKFADYDAIVVSDAGISFPLSVQKSLMKIFFVGFVPSPNYLAQRQILAERQQVRSDRNGRNR